MSPSFEICSRCPRRTGEESTIIPCARADGANKRLRKVPRDPNPKRLPLDVGGARCGLGGLNLDSSNCGIPQDRDARNFRHHFTQQLYLFAAQLG